MPRNLLGRHIQDAVPKKIRMNPKRAILRMSDREQKLKIEELKEALREIDRKEAEVKAENPFWFYSPVTGDISDERKAFLRKYIRDEDIPQRLDSSVDFHCSEAGIRGASGGNQSSKTTSLIVDFLITATGALPNCFDPEQKAYHKWTIPEKRWKNAEPQHCRIIGEDYQNGILRNLLPALRKWTPKEYLLGGDFEKSYAAGEQVLRLFKPGTRDLAGTIELMSGKQDLGSFQGPPRNKIGYDEEPGREVYKENLLRFTTAKNLDVVFAMTPTKGLSWTYDLFTKGKDESGNNVAWFQIASVCNPHANMQVLGEIMDELESYEEMKMRLLGEFISLSGLVYGKIFQPSLHVIPPFETGCTCGAKTMSHSESCPWHKYLCFLGVDPHMVKDSTSVLCAIDREDNFYVDRCYKRPVDTDKFKEDMQSPEFLGGHRLGKAIFDPSSDSSITVFGGNNIFDLCTKGKNRIPRAIKADKFHGSIAAGVDTMKRRMKINERTKTPTFFIMNRPENQELIKSFKIMQRESYVREEVKGMKDKIAEGVHDHHACVRYINQMKLHWYPPVSAEVPNIYEESGCL